MGDRTTVYVKLRKSDADLPEVLAILEDEGYSAVTDDDVLGTREFEFSESYSDLDMESELRRLMLPYDKRWDAIDVYLSGQEKIRFPGPGQGADVYQILDSERIALFDEMMRLSHNVGFDAAAKKLKAYLDGFSDVLPLEEIDSPSTSPASDPALHMALAGISQQAML